MGVDSGLPDFRGDEGFWNAYPPFRKLGLSFVDLADPRWFADNPAQAWGFTGTVWNSTDKRSLTQVMRSSSNGLIQNDTVVSRIPAMSIAILNWRGLLRIGLLNVMEVFRSCSVANHVAQRFGLPPVPIFQSKKPRCWPMIRCLIVLTAIRLLARIF